MAQLFISYAHADGEVVNEICMQLREAGHDVWIDVKGIEVGDLWVAEIVKGILGCDFFLLFVSSKSMSSDFVRREVDIAFGEKKKILIIRLEEVSIPIQLIYQLVGIQYIDFTSQNWQEKLLTIIKGHSISSPFIEKNTKKVKNPFAAIPVLDRNEHHLVLENRQKEIQEALKQLTTNRLLLITGLPGIGKSTFARALIDFKPVGTPPPFWYNFERQRSTGNTLGVLLEHLSRYLDVCLDADVHEQVMAFRNTDGGVASSEQVDELISYLNQDMPIWLIFDNLETVLSAETSRFLDMDLELLFDGLLNNTHNARIIVTTPSVPLLSDESELREAGIPAFTLDGLNDDAAVTLLREFSGQDLAGEKIESLVRDINGNPFILNHFARYIQLVGPSILDDPTLAFDGVTERFGESIKKRLSLQEFKAIQTLTVLNREISLTGLCRVACVEMDVIVRLREMGLLQRTHEGKFWLHKIVRNSLKQMDEDLKQRSHVRAMSFYRSSGIPVIRETIDDYSNILEWHYHAAEAPDVLSAYAALYSTGLKEQLMAWNEYDLLVRLCKRTLAAIYQVEANLKEIQANLSANERLNIYHTLGIAYFLLGDFVTSTAHLEAALNLLSPQDDTELRIQLLIDLAESLNGRGDASSAMDSCRELELLLPKIDNKMTQAKFLHLRGIIYRDTGDFERAVNDFKEALILYTDLKDDLHLANCTVDLGVVYYGQHRFNEAIQNYRQAMVIFEKRQDMRAAVITHINIGDIKLQCGDCEEAEREAQLALDIAQKRKLRNWELFASLVLVDAQIALLKLDEAENRLLKLKPLVENNNSGCVKGQEKYLTACLYWKRQNPAQAENNFRQAFELFADAGCEEQKTWAQKAYSSFMKEQQSQM